MTPVSTHSLNQSFDALGNVSFNALQGTPHFPDSDIVQTLPDPAAWSFQTAGESIQSLPSAPPPRDFSSVPRESNESLWPLSPTQTVWRCNFDFQFTEEPENTSFGVGSSAVGDLDLAAYYNQPLQSPSSAGLSKDLTEHCNLSRKVGTKV